MSTRAQPNDSTGAIAKNLVDSVALPFDQTDFCYGLIEVQKHRQEITESGIIILKQWILFFARFDWLLKQGISNTIHYFSERETPNSRKLRVVTNLMVSWFAFVTNREISQIIKQAVPEMNKEGDAIRFGSFNRQSLVCLA